MDIYVLKVIMKLKKKKMQIYHGAVKRFTPQIHSIHQYISFKDSTQIQDLNTRQF